MKTMIVKFDYHAVPLETILRVDIEEMDDSLEPYRVTMFRKAANLYKRFSTEEEAAKEFDRVTSLWDEYLLYKLRGPQHGTSI